MVKLWIRSERVYKHDFKYRSTLHSSSWITTLCSDVLLLQWIIFFFPHAISQYYMVKLWIRSDRVYRHDFSYRSSLHSSSWNSNSLFRCDIIIMRNTNFIFRLYLSTIWLNFESDLIGSVNGHGTLRGSQTKCFRDMIR